MKVKVSELSGAALDWTVAKCEGHTPRFQPHFVTLSPITYLSDWDTADEYSPSTDWTLGGPIIDREKLSVGTRHTNDHIYWDTDVLCWARNSIGGFLKYGPTPLIAAMRCIVSAKLGDEVEVPDELL